jgi:hypothetical protein
MFLIYTINNMENKLSQMLSFRLSKTDREIIEQLAKEKEISVGRLLRQLTSKN